MTTFEEAKIYLLDYVAAGVTFIRETKDGYVFALTEAFHHADGTKVKILKSTAKWRIDEYQVLKK